jgi:hypothetical protein
MSSDQLNRDIAIVIYSRGREEMLARLVDDMSRFYMPALEVGGMNACTFIYAQGYARAYLDRLAHDHAEAIASGRLIISEAVQAHSRIGEVFASAATALHAKLDYRLAMLMDDDSLYRAEPQVDSNLRQAARNFRDEGHRAYSIKLGQSRNLEYWPYINAEGPVMPFKEKMLWVSRAVMEEALAHPRFAQLDVGEDAVLAGVAWKGDAARCYAVFGMASFLHLGFEPDEEVPEGPRGGGYGELVGYDEARAPDPELGKYGKAFRGGVVPFTVMPDVFVGPEHPHHTISGIKPEAVARYGARYAGFNRLR